LPQLGTLADQLRLVFYDQRGGGRSRTGTPRPTWRDHVDDLAAICRELVPERTAVPLLGYSWGGLLALLYALERPEGVSRLALVSPAPPHAGYRTQMQENLRMRTKRAEAAGMQGFPLAVAAYFADPTRAHELTPFRVQTNAEQSTLASLGDYDLRPRLSTLRAEILVLHGTEDVIPIRHSEELARLLPSARLVSLAGCGHVPYIEAPDQLFAELRAFLR
jgi:proline iminopeptidase